LSGNSATPPPLTCSAAQTQSPQLSRYTAQQHQQHQQPVHVNYRVSGQGAVNCRCCGRPAYLHLSIQADLSRDACSAYAIQYTCVNCLLPATATERHAERCELAVRYRVAHKSVETCLKEVLIGHQEIPNNLKKSPQPFYWRKLCHSPRIDATDRAFSLRMRAMRIQHWASCSFRRLPLCQISFLLRPPLLS